MPGHVVWDTKYTFGFKALEYNYPENIKVLKKELMYRYIYRIIKLFGLIFSYRVAYNSNLVNLGFLEYFTISLSILNVLIN